MTSDGDHATLYLSQQRRLEDMKVQSMSLNWGRRVQYGALRCALDLAARIPHLRPLAESDGFEMERQTLHVGSLYTRLRSSEETLKSLRDRYCTSYANSDGELGMCRV